MKEAGNRVADRVGIWNMHEFSWNSHLCFSLCRFFPVTFSRFRFWGRCMNEAEADSNMPKKCPQCGATLPEGALAGLCPACLLKQGAEAETSTQSEAEKFQPPSVEEVAKL